MKFQTFYMAENLDYEATYENLCNRFSSVEMKKGIITFYVPPRKISVQISPNRKVGIVWGSAEEKEKVLPFLEKNFVGENGKRVVLKALKCHVTNIPYPPPEKFSIAWCKEKFKFSRVVSGFFDWLERRAERKERELLWLEAECYALKEEFLMDEDKYNSEPPEEKAKRRQKYRKIVGLV